MVATKKQQQRRWTAADDRLAVAWTMTLDDVAFALERTDREILERLRELDVLPHRKEPEPLATPIDDAPAPAELKLAGLGEEPARGAQAMAADEAEAVARRVLLHLYRGSIDAAREALEDGWREHERQFEPLPMGAELLEEPLARVLDDVRLLTLLEKGGILTIGHLLAASEADLFALDNVGTMAVAKLRQESQRLRQRAGLPPRQEPPPKPELKRKPRGRPARPTAAIAPELRKAIEDQTLRLLPLIERLAQRSKIPLPIEDLVQEGALAVFRALPKFDPNRLGTSGRPAKIETWLAPRIVGAFQDYARKHGRLLHGGGRTGRRENVRSIDAVVLATDAGRETEFGSLLVDDGWLADQRLRGGGEWAAVLKGFSDRERLVVLSYFVAGQTQAQIAAGLGLSESAVSIALKRVLTRLRQLDAADGRLQELIA